MPFDKFLRALALTVIALVPGACSSFAPVYGGASGAGLENVRFNFAPPENRLEQVVLNRLKIAFPGTPSATDPVLDVDVSTASLPGSQSNAFSVGRPANIRVSGSVTIRQGDEIVFSANRFSQTAYQGDRLTPVDLMTKSGTQENAAESVAESLRAAILAGYRPQPALVRPLNNALQPGSAALPRP